MLEKTPNLPHYQTLEELLNQYATPFELARDIDEAMLLLVILMHYEPGRARQVTGSYESLWELRNLILNQVKN